MRGRPPKRKFTPEQEKAANAFVEGAKTDETSNAAPAASQDEKQGREYQFDAEPLESKPLEPTAEPPDERILYPWEEPRVRDDVVKGYSLRLPEPLYLKLKYLSNETGKSMNEICKQAVRGVIERKLGEHTGGA